MPGAPSILGVLAESVSGRQSYAECLMDADTVVLRGRNWGVN